MEAVPDLYGMERVRMVRDQIRSRGILDARVLDVMARVPRHFFVPGSDREDAYADEPLSVGHGQTISQPYIVAYMTEALGLKPPDRVLEIGTGTGYQTAVLAAMVREVYTVELLEPLARAAVGRLRELRYSNVFFRTGDGWDGWPEAAPFDKVIVTAAAPEVPHALIDQLREGGRLVIPVGCESQEIVIGEKNHGILKEDRKIAVRFVPLVRPGR